MPSPCLLDAVRLCGIVGGVALHPAGEALAVAVCRIGLPILLWASWLAHPRHAPAGRRRRQVVARVHRQHAGTFTRWRSSSLIALGVQFADTHGITTDGVIYFSQLRSVIFDRDLDVAAEFAYLRQPPRPSHVVPIGPTFVWLPLYLVVAAVDAVGRALGVVDGARRGGRRSA